MKVQILPFLFLFGCANFWTDGPSKEQMAAHNLRVRADAEFERNCWKSEETGSVQTIMDEHGQIIFMKPNCGMGVNTGTAIMGAVIDQIKVPIGANIARGIVQQLQKQYPNMKINTQVTISEPPEKKEED